MHLIKKSNDKKKRKEDKKEAKKYRSECKSIESQRISEVVVEGLYYGIRLKIILCL